MWRKLIVPSLSLIVCLPACRSGYHIPNPSMTGKPGVLERAWEAEHGSAEPDWEPCPDPDDPKVPFANITEIAIERTPCYGYCATYTLTFRSDGTVTYFGQGNVEKVGTHTGHLDPGSFNFLARLAVDIGFFDLKDFYGCFVTDAPSVYVSIVRNGQRKTIKHYAPDLYGPPRLWMLETLIDDAYNVVEWDPAPQR